MHAFCTTVLSAILAIHPADYARRHDAGPTLTSLPHGSELSFAKVHHIDRDASSIILAHDEAQAPETPRRSMRLFAAHPEILDHIEQATSSDSAQKIVMVI